MAKYAAYIASFCFHFSLASGGSSLIEKLPQSLLKFHADFFLMLLKKPDRFPDWLDRERCLTK
jgi:hypothetical protein